MAPQRFYDGQPGPDIRRELNNLEAIFDDAIANAKGPQGWAPVVAVVTDDARRVLQITDWTGGEGSKPTDTGFIGATGIVATAALAVDIRGSIGATGPSNTLAIGTVTSAASPSATITGTSPNQTLNLVLPKGDKGDTGNTGPANTLTIGTVTTGAASATITGTAPSQVLNLVVPQGIQGIQGNAGWSPIFATVVDGERRVLQLVDWTGGTGSKPATGEYVGATGLVATITQAVDIRGPSGAGTGNVNPTGVIAANDLAAFDDASGQVIKALKAADLPVSTATQTALDGKAPLNGTGTSGTWPISTTGNAATATKLATARTINGTTFDGSANISVSVDWASVTGKPAVIAAGADAAAARTAIGAGTSSLTLGTGAGTALEGNTPYQAPLVSGTNIKTVNGASLLGSGDVVTGDVTLSGVQTLTNKTLTNPILTSPVFNDGYTEEVFAVTGTAPALSPTNGSIQTLVLSGNSTPTAGTWASGQSMTLMVDDGSAYTINWASMSIAWKTGGGTAPTLLTTGYTVIELVKVGSAIYGWLAGDA